MKKHVKLVVFKLLKLFYSFAPFDVLDLINLTTHKKGFMTYNEKDFFLMHIPKSAGTSIYASLGLCDPGHITWERAVSMNSEIANKKIVVIMRNPADRLFSTYNYAYRKVKEQPFTGVQRIGNFDNYAEFLRYVDVTMLPLNYYFLLPVSKIYHRNFHREFDLCFF